MYLHSVLILMLNACVRTYVEAVCMFVCLYNTICMYVHTYVCMNILAYVRMYVCLPFGLVHMFHVWELPRTSILFMCGLMQ